jgi:hypothetical protein
VVVIAQVKIRAHPCESNMFHGCCKMDWIMFVPPWCPKPVSDLQLHTIEDFEHVSFGKVREVGVLSCNVLQCRLVWTWVTVRIIHNTGNPVFQVQIVKISACCGVS